MNKKETIEVLQSIEDRATDFPYMTACDWVAIAAAKRHLSEEFSFSELVSELVQDIVDNEKGSGDEKKPKKYFVNKYLPKFNAVFQKDDGEHKIWHSADEKPNFRYSDVLGTNGVEEILFKADTIASNHFDEYGVIYWTYTNDLIKYIK